METKKLESNIQKFCIIRFPNEIQENLNELIGLKFQKKILNNIISTAKNILRLEIAGLNPNLSALLYGPPGVGKTVLTRAICKENNAVLIEICPSNIFESYFGETLKNISSMFKWIGEYADIKLKDGFSTILFIDEFDSLARERADATEIGEMKRAVNELLRSIDLLMYEKHALVILAATNHEFTLDTAVWRRFLYHIPFPLPDLNVRKEILNNFLNNLIKLETRISLDFDLDTIAKKLEGFSPSDIERLVRSLYVEFLSFPKMKNFIINDEKILFIIKYIGGTKDRLGLSVIKEEIDKSKSKKEQNNYSISDLLKEEIEKTKKKDE